MSADFWAGYLSGAAGILLGNPLDLIKTRLQAGPAHAATSDPHHAASAPRSNYDRLSTLVRGTSAPILGYGALNALLFVTYNRSMALLDEDPAHVHALGKTWLAGAVAGLATFVVSAPTELVKCRVQVSRERTSSVQVVKGLWRDGGVRGLYLGGGVTSLRDGVGYGF